VDRQILGRSFNLATTKRRRVICNFRDQLLDYHTKLMATGAIGVVVACCATPFLAILLGAIGLSAVTGYLDYVVLPTIALCLGVVVYGLTKRKPA
jgi:mercuric ion transport protein